MAERKTFSILRAHSTHYIIRCPLRRSTGTFLVAEFIENTYFQLKLAWISTKLNVDWTTKSPLFPESWTYRELKSSLFPESWKYLKHIFHVCYYGAIIGSWSLHSSQESCKYVILLLGFPGLDQFLNAVPVIVSLVIHFEKIQPVLFFCKFISNIWLRWPKRYVQQTRIETLCR